MTLEQADKIAELVRNAPHMYDSIPSLDEGIKPVLFDSSTYSAYPWISLGNHLGGLLLSDVPRNPNVYLSRQGFSAAYSSIIKDWQATEIRGRTSFGQRYVTIDDIRMMAYLGLEYAKAKLDGWRYRFGYVEGLDNESEFTPKGCIVRIENGQRFVHRSIGNVTAPPGSGGTYSDLLDAYTHWTPMKRMPGFNLPTIGQFKLPDEYELPAEATSDIVLLGTIEGNDDMVKFGPHQSNWSSGSGRTLYEPNSIVTEGGMEIIVATADSLSEDDLETSVVAYQQRMQRYYLVSTNIYDSNGKLKEVWTYDTIQQPSNGEKYSVRTMVESNSGFVPLRKGIVYTVFAKFDSAVLKANNYNPDRNLVSYVRYGMRQTAPFMWTSQGRHQNPA